MTADLAAWLSQVWDEQEKIAKDGDWGIRSGSTLWVGAISSPGIAPGIVASPAYTLARIAADRLILEEHRNEYSDAHRMKVGGLRPTCARCGIPGEYNVSWPCQTVRLLAQPYADREGWRDEWRVL